MLSLRAEFNQGSYKEPSSCPCISLYVGWLNVGLAKARFLFRAAKHWSNLMLLNLLMQFKTLLIPSINFNVAQIFAFLQRLGKVMTTNSSLCSVFPVLTVHFCPCVHSVFTHSGFTAPIFVHVLHILQLLTQTTIDMYLWWVSVDHTEMMKKAFMFSAPNNLKSVTLAEFKDCC